MPERWEQSPATTNARSRRFCVAPNPCTDVCDYTGVGTVLGGTPGGVGGAGSSGGSGGSGLGGDSYAYYAIGGTVTVSGTALSCGSGGTSPPPIAGVNGTNGSGTCHN